MAELQRMIMKVRQKKRAVALSHVMTRSGIPYRQDAKKRAIALATYADSANLKESQPTGKPNGVLSGTRTQTK